MAVLELRGFGVALGARTILRDLTASIASTGCTVLLGPSGTGKSTLLRTLAGYNRAIPQLRTWGEALYAGAPCAPGHEPALVMQNSRLLVATVLENLVCGMPGRTALTRRDQLDALAPLLAECEQQALLPMSTRQVVELPLATQRIVAVLREAVAAPELLMIDEPTAGLDAAEADRVLAVIRALARRRALLVVLHNLLQARETAQDILLVAGGQVQEAQPASRYFAEPASASGRQFLATGSCPEPADPEAQAEPPPACAPMPQTLRMRGGAAHVAQAACGPRGFVWLLPGQLAGTPWPGVIRDAAQDLRSLQEVGVTWLISLTEEPFPPAQAAPYGMRCLAFPMPDMHAPTIRQALDLCARIDWLLGQGDVVAVHCRAGLGRTGTVLAAYWLWRAQGRLSAVRALEDVRRLEPLWVQSQVQVDFLAEFALVVADTLASGRASNDPADAPQRALSNP